MTTKNLPAQTQVTVATYGTSDRVLYIAIPQLGVGLRFLHESMQTQTFKTEHRPEFLVRCALGRICIPLRAEAEANAIGRLTGMFVSEPEAYDAKQIEGLELLELSIASTNIPTEVIVFDEAVAPAPSYEDYLAGMSTEQLMAEAVKLFGEMTPEEQDEVNAGIDQLSAAPQHTLH